MGGGGGGARGGEGEVWGRLVAWRGEEANWRGLCAEGEGGESGKQ